MQESEKEGEKRKGIQNKREKENLERNVMKKNPKEK